jgi:hypothetical protein
MATRRGLKQAIGERYRAAGRWERRQILDQFTRVTGYHRKHALRVLHSHFVARPPRPRRRIYDEAVRRGLTMLWKPAVGSAASGYGATSPSDGDGAPLRLRCAPARIQHTLGKQWAWRSVTFVPLGPIAARLGLRARDFGQVSQIEPPSLSRGVLPLLLLRASLQYPL